jgi:hypothetical protein
VTVPPTSGLLVFDPSAAAMLAGRARLAGGAVDALAGRLGAVPLPDGDPWWTDPALVLVTDIACKRLLAVAAEFDLVAFALRSAEVFYRDADDRAAVRLRDIGRPEPPGDRAAATLSRPTTTGRDRAW